MAVQRTYAGFGDACRAANALDLVGGRWSLVIVRELILGPKRFVDLQAAARGITPAVLSDRLRSLQEAGIIEQVTLPDLARTRAYLATDWGRGLEPVLQALGRWYSAGPDPRTVGGMTPDAVVLAMRTLAPAVPADLPTVALRLYDGRQSDPFSYDYRIGAGAETVVVQAGRVDAPAATVTADSTAWSEVLFGALTLAQARRDATIRVDGDASAARRVIALYRA